MAEAINHTTFKEKEMKRVTKAPEFTEETPIMEPEQPTAETNFSQAMSAPKMGSLLSLLSNNIGGGYDTQETEKYVTTIKEFFDRTPVAGYQVNTTWLNGMPGVLAIECNKKVILMIFASFFNHLGELTPVTAMNLEARNTYANTISNAHEFINFLVITPSDYPKVKVMIESMINIFTVINRPEFRSLDISTFADSGYIISTSPKDIMEKLERYYPHGVLPRADFGFCMYKKPQKEQQFFGPEQFFSQRQERDFIGVVAGYTEFLHSGQTINNQPKYLPVCHLSTILPVIPDLSLTAMLLPIATGLFLKYGMWHKSVKHFTKDMPNVGRLFTDLNDNSLMFVDNEKKYEAINNMYFEPPVLVMDVVEGIYRVPGIEKYAAANRQGELIEMFSRFTKQPWNVNSISSFFQHEYIGTVMQNNRLIDSRWCDYLNTIVHHESDAETVRKLLWPSAEPKHKATTQKELYPNFNVLYSNMICPLNLEFMNHVQASIGNYISIITQGLSGMDASIINLDQLIQSGRQYSSTPGVGFGGSTAMFGSNPFTALY